jgi:hypothetical protein
MAITDVLFTSVSKKNLTNSQTMGVLDADETKISEFLTIQSLANFAAMTGALTVAWKALEHIGSAWTTSYWVPFALSEAWALVSLVLSASQQDRVTQRSLGFWIPALFIGFINSLILFAAVLGLK